MKITFLSVALAGWGAGSIVFSLLRATLPAVCLAVLAGAAFVPRAAADLLVLNSPGGGNGVASDVKRFNATTGAYVGSFGYETEGFYALTLTPQGEVLVNSNILGVYELYRFNLAGQFRGTSATGRAAGLSAAARGPDGNLYSIWYDDASGTPRIVRFATGEPATFVAHGTGGMTAPTWMVFGRDGNLYVNDAQLGVLRFNGSTGAALGVFVPLGRGGLQDVTRMLFGADGRLYAASGQANAVLRFDGVTGEFIDTFVAAGSGGLSNPRGLAFGPDGHLCVTSQRTNQVLRYHGGTGAYLGVAAAVNASPGDPTVRLSDIVFEPGIRGTDTVWFDDELPAGAVAGTSNGGSWAWVTSSPTPVSGSRAHRANATARNPGLQEHYFNFATQTLQIGMGDHLFVDAWVEDRYATSEIMISWCDGSWEHRAFWGANLIAAGGEGTESRRYMGTLPRSGWVRLEVPASLLGLEGRTVQGIAFSVYNNAATFDRAGKISFAGAAAVGDTTAPTIRLTAPLPNATVAGWVTTTAEVTDNDVVRSVDVAVDGTVVRSASGARSVYSADWDSTRFSNGAHVVTVIATDGAGNKATSAPVTVTVDNPVAPPSGGTPAFWVDDALPAGAWGGSSGGDSWTWVSAGPAPFVGARSHQSSAAAGMHEHYFNDASAPLVVAENDVLIAQVYLDPANPVREVMLSFFDGTSWEHRAFWGEDLIGYGTAGTDSRRYVAALPASGQWVRLEVAAARVGLAGKSIYGMGFAAFDGRVTWDGIGKLAATSGTAAPAVTFTAPATGATVAGSVSVSANATGEGIASVQFFLDDAPLQAADTVAPYSIVWDSRTAAEGAHVLAAVATDNSGRVSPRATVTLNVANNSTPPPSGSDVVWFDDDLPSGAATGGSGGDGWTWVTANPAPAAGLRAHQSAAAPGLHEHYFDWAYSGEFAVSPSDSLFVWVYPDPANPPREIMLSWRDANGWEHRAYWGENLISYGTDGTPSRLRMGALPAPGIWTKLVVPASSVGLGAAPLIGMSFSAFDGRVTWDAAGKRAGGATDTSQPTVSITAPAPGAVVSGSAVAITTVATDDVGVSSVAFYVGATLLATDTTQPFSAVWNTATVANGSHTLTAVARDAAGNLRTSEAVIVTVDNAVTTGPDTTAPRVSISAPLDAQVVSGNAVSVTAAATDDVGIASVQFRIDGVTVGAALTAAPFTYAWNSTSVSNGSHSIVAVARDAAGNEGASAPIVVSVNNSTSGGAVIWVDSAVPSGAWTGASGGDAWTWVTSGPAPFSGTRVHQSAIAGGVHEHFFTGASSVMDVSAGDVLFVYVYLDPANPPRALMLSWFDGNWEHRAYWGENLFPYGTEGTASRRRMGGLPATGQWVQLQIPAAQVGLEGRTLSGMSFSLFDGRATWDVAGKVRP